MLTDEQVDKLAEFMGWHLGEVYENNEYVQCWMDDEGQTAIPLEWWNPDSDMTDAWMLIDHVKAHGAEAMNEFQGWLSLLSYGDKGGEIQMRVSIFELTPELICKATFKLMGL